MLFVTRVRSVILAKSHDDGCPLYGERRAHSVPEHLARLALHWMCGFPCPWRPALCPRPCQSAIEHWPHLRTLAAINDEVLYGTGVSIKNRFEDASSGIFVNS